MEAMVFKVFSALFRMVGILLMTGTMAIALSDIQKKAASQHAGLISLLKVNQQLVGRTH